MLKSFRNTYKNKTFGKSNIIIVLINFNRLYIYLDGVKAQDGTKYDNDGNVSYELHVRHTTAVCNLGLMPDNMP